MFNSIIKLYVNFILTSKLFFDMKCNNAYTYFLWDLSSIYTKIYGNSRLILDNSDGIYIIREIGPLLKFHFTDRNKFLYLRGKLKTS